jgi:hypothetical protein
MEILKKIKEILSQNNRVLDEIRTRHLQKIKSVDLDFG